ncbi:MAG: pyridoxamine 5'-phosphate oxidase [Phycisphaeraceae bacterium]|nr:pyridoxamine 5'-phosphate oxidase [Phycisphaeraceae bacterium]MBX3405404.1 pyridoxamine 5'-phosphate oxidase [Phycisphaeraceae bacterium]
MTADRNLAVFDQSDPRAGWGVDQLLPESLPADPFPLFVSWFNLARDRRVQPNTNALSLATIDADGTPAVRIVLCKDIDSAAGSFTFHTNYRGRKGRALDANPRAAAAFHWDTLDLQARFEGLVARASAAESDAYFATRSWMSRIGAWSSDQSEPVASRAAMLARVDATLRRFGIDPANPPAPEARVDIPRPPHWGGFRFVAASVELWVGSKVRLHDRACWQRPLAETRDASGRVVNAAGAGPWVATRLQP